MGTSKFFEKKFAILQEISSAIITAHNISTIANLMLDLAVNYTTAEKGSLMLVNERNELYILAAKGMDIQLISSYKVKIGEGIVGTVAKNRRAVLVEDIEKDERFKGKKRDRYKTRSFISCPIVSKNRLLGVFNINDKKDGTPFTEDEFALIKVIADQAAVALENAFLVNQLRVNAAELETINRKLIEADVVKTESLTYISHELRTPLNSIKGAVYYLRQAGGLPKSEQKEFYDIIAEETDKLVSIVENLLDFLRLEDEARIVTKSIISLPELLEETVNSKLLKSILAKKNIQVQLNVKEDTSDIVGDKIRVLQLFINLIESLSYYLEDDDIIKINVKESDSVLVNLTIPRRMPDTILPYLFNSRHTLQKDQSEERLKLYLAWKVAELHRWELNVEDTNSTLVVSIKIPKSTRQKIEAVIDTTMEMFIEFISELLGVNTCSIMLLDELTGELSIRSARGLDENIVKRTRIRFGDRIAGWVALEGAPLLIENIESDPRFGKRNMPHYNTKSLLCLPLKMQDKVIGVLNLNNKVSSEPFTSKDLHIASVLSERVSRFIEGLYTGKYREDSLKHFVTSFDGLLNAEKKYHKKDALFPNLMIEIMNRLDAKEEDKRLALYISMIYDLGLTLIDESVLKKKQKLSSMETRTLKVHPYTTLDLLNSFEFSEDVKKAILHHHERYDGTGYPDGLKGNQIPFLSRVLSVVDAFCAMTAKRPYRKAFTREKALQEIKKGAGKLYDPKVVKALESTLKLL
jgi:hypothetical protein